MERLRCPSVCLYVTTDFFVSCLLLNRTKSFYGQISVVISHSQISNPSLGEVRSIQSDSYTVTVAHYLDLFTIFTANIMGFINNGSTNFKFIAAQITEAVKEVNNLYRVLRICCWIGLIISHILIE